MLSRVRRAALTGAVLASIALAGQSQAAVDERQTVVDMALSQVGVGQYRMGATGPTSYDCSGFVWFVFSSSGLADRVGATRSFTADQYYRWFKAHGLTFTDPKQLRPGDLVFRKPGYTRAVKHIGIATTTGLKSGRFKETGALNPTWDVRTIRSDELSPPVYAFGHTDLRFIPDPPPPPTPTPSPVPTASPTPSVTPEPTPVTTEAPPSPEPTESPSPQS